MSSNISLVIVRRLLNDLEQSVATEEYGTEQCHLILTVGKGGSKQNEH